MIDTWLQSFHDAWKARAIDAVMDLFTDDVEYWETPHTLLRDKNRMREEWQAILEQEEITVNWTRFNSSNDNRYSVIWDLEYKQAGVTKQSAGVYLIQLNESGVCNYFYYVGEERK